MYSIQELETFVQVARCGGITMAARQLDIAAATASHRITKLEHALKLTLFHRNSRSMTLTDEGQIFVDRVEGILEQLSAAEFEAGSGQTELRGHLRVTLSPWILSKFILPRLAEFQELHPGLTVEFLAVDRYVSMVEEGQDCAIRIGELEDSSLVARRICTNSRVICAAPSYLKRHGTPASIAELTIAKWVCLPWQTRVAVLNDNGKSQLFTAERNVLVSSSDMLTAAAVQGLGLAMKSRLAIHEEIEDGILVEVMPTTLDSAEAPIWYVTSQQARTGHKTKVFGDFVSETFSRIHPQA